MPSHTVDMSGKKCHRASINNLIRNHELFILTHLISIGHVASPRTHVHLRHFHCHIDKECPSSKVNRSALCTYMQARECTSQTNKQTHITHWLASNDRQMIIFRASTVVMSKFWFILLPHNQNCVICSSTI